MTEFYKNREKIGNLEKFLLTLQRKCARINLINLKKQQLFADTYLKKLIGGQN